MFVIEITFIEFESGNPSKQYYNGNINGEHIKLSNESNKGTQQKNRTK